LKKIFYMHKCYIFFLILSFFLVNCSYNKNENNLKQNISYQFDYSFDEYLNLLLKMNKTAKDLDINSVPN